MLLDFVAGESAARRTAYRRERIAVAAADLIADQRASHAARNHADSVSLAFGFDRHDGIHDAAFGTGDGFSLAGPAVRAALGVLRRAGRRFCARQPARDGGCASTLNMITEIAAMISSGYNQPFWLDVFDVSNAACMMNSPQCPASGRR